MDETTNIPADTPAPVEPGQLDSQQQDAIRRLIKDDIGRPLEPNVQTANYTLFPDDAGKLVDLNKASAITLTVPPHSAVPFPLDTRILFRQKGAGQVTLTAGAGVTLDTAVGTKTVAQYSVGGILKIAANTWAVMGDLTT